MNDKESFESLKPNYDAIEKNEIKQPNLPVDVANDEAMYLYEIAIRDKVKFASTDVDVALIESLPVRVGGLRYAQSRWTQVFAEKSDAEKQWSLISAEGFELRDEILHFCRYAYRKDKALMDIVYRIADGATNADMIQDLSELSMLGKNNPSQLEAVSFDLLKLDRAAELAEQGGLLLGKVNGDRDDNLKVDKDMRDRAFNYLKEAVDNIREAGRFLFWKDEEKAEQYTSAYFRKLREAREKKEEQDA
ncbi:hypothetical protein [Ancylomarina sp. 16SWW S1-10-2]|uniref:hypothetical protein n=1 Tax=Ancylomarina sp. 16SWW S1-10-2 TaxID=2499681 RepID=UPI0012AD26B6|nr:hypothetical protein [Ancylomarina sp. 16SWW S1-10-2]MRT93870.1 hypothetical protein [Ancylomarina sp. 16SWW S1-10-2]